MNTLGFERPLAYPRCPFELPNRGPADLTPRNARQHWTKARDLHAKIGMPHMVKPMQEWLDSLPPPSDPPP